MPRAIRLCLGAIFIALAALAGPAAAEDPPVALIADSIEYDAATSVVTATGAVQVFYGERTLTADRIVYDSANDRISAEGRITLRTGEGETVFADFADIDADLRDGLVRGAQSVIADGGAKIAAVEARRVEDRYNVLHKAVFSPCEVCAARPVPLWRIRARRIIHDQEKGEIHYEDAYFDVMGVQVGYLPYFRHPSPEVRRATGFLPPQAEIDHAYGAAVKLPFYLVIDDHSDVTLTPFLSYGDGALLEVEYRRKFERGFVELDLSGGVTNYGDDNRGARARLGGFGEGRYLTEGEVHLGFDLAFAADDPFLRRYDYTDADRLTTEAFARVYDGRSYATVSAAYLQSLRDNEDQDAIPFVVPTFSARHVIDAPGVGGEFGLSLDGIALNREDGRDVGRVSLGVDWSRQVVLPVGLALRGFADARADYYAIGDDPAFDDDATRLAPRAGVEARMPFVRADDDGGTHIVEPIVQLVAAPLDIENGDIPNEDSVLAEYDATNLFEPDRQPGFDRYESGTRITVGGRYDYHLGNGTSIRAAAGRIFRFDRINDFSGGAGLNDDDADYVAALDVTLTDWAELRSSWRFSDDLDIERGEIGGRIRRAPLTLHASYLFVEKDPAAQSPVDRSELTFGGGLALDRNWAVTAEARRDLIADRFVTAGAVLSYQDECAGFEFYARRRFTESDRSPEGTTVGLRVRLFGAGGDRSKASGVCAYDGAPRK